MPGRGGGPCSCTTLAHYIPEHAICGARRTWRPRGASPGSWSTAWWASTTAPSPARGALWRHQAERPGPRAVQVRPGRYPYLKYVRWQCRQPPMRRRIQIRRPCLSTWGCSEQCRLCGHCGSRHVCDSRSWCFVVVCVSCRIVGHSCQILLLLSMSAYLERHVSDLFEWGVRVAAMLNLCQVVIVCQEPVQGL